MLNLDLEDARKTLLKGKISRTSFHRYSLETLKLLCSENALQVHGTGKRGLIKGDYIAALFQMVSFKSSIRGSWRPVAVEEASGGEYDACDGAPSPWNVRKCCQRWRRGYGNVVRANGRRWAWQNKVSEFHRKNKKKWLYFIIASKKREGTSQFEYTEAPKTVNICQRCLSRSQQTETLTSLNWPKWRTCLKDALWV